MAGIGFELKKLFAGRGVFMKIRAYTYAGIISSGTMVLAVMMLLALQELASVFQLGENERNILVVLMTYAMLLSLLLTSGMQMLLSRFVADQLFSGATDRVIPSLIGGALTLMLPGGALYGLLLWNAQQLPVADRLLNWLLFMLLIPVWLQMSYITAAKDYKRVLWVFLGGILLTMALAIGLLAFGFSPITGIMLALVSGYGYMLLGFTRVLLRYFPQGNGSPFYFIGWLSQTPRLFWIGCFTMLGAFAHMFIMWFSPLGESVAGGFRQAASHDAAAFYASLVTIPSSIQFIVSVEVNFYSEYREYFQAVRAGGMLSEIHQARDRMIYVLHQEISHLANIQIFCMLAYAIIMRYFLERIGFTTEMIAMFQIMTVGYSAYALGNSMMLLQLYYNDQRDALFSSFLFLASNVLLTLLFSRMNSIFYGVGFALAGMLMYAFALYRLIHYVNDIDYHVFCEQPVLNREKNGLFLRLAKLLDRGAAHHLRKSPHSSKEVSL